MSVRGWMDGSVLEGVASVIFIRDSKRLTAEGSRGKHQDARGQEQDVKMCNVQAHLGTVLAPEKV